MLAYYRVNHFNQVLEAFHRSSLRIPLREARGTSLAGRLTDGNKATLFHTVPPLAYFSPKSLVMQRSLAVISAWPGIQATQNLVSGNNTQWITPGWWKQESLVWQDSTCFTLNSQCWNNDGISQGNTRSSKGFLWLWKRIAAQGAVTSFLFRAALLWLLFIW